MIIGFVNLAPPTVVVLASPFPLAIAPFVTFPVNFTKPTVRVIPAQGSLVLSQIAVNDTVVDA